ncbi:MAG: PQQ-binding-like beta-propeller repeat protein [Bacteroidetes bacterium]|nr:PQQ-binding-like beta-propeller repeat protein [Bacteroidota bacterium]
MKRIRSIAVYLSLISSVIFSGCFSLSIDKRVEVNPEEDWLMIGGNPQKTNVSRSDSLLNPPFNLYWQYDVDGGLAKNCISVSDAIVFVNTLNGESYALDIFSGKSLGRTSAMGSSSYSTPLIDNNNIIVTSSGIKGNMIFSYNLISGIEKWKRNIGSVESSPVMVGEDLLVCSVNNKIYRLNSKTGYIVWVTRPRNERFPQYSFYNSPTVYGDQVFAGNNGGSMFAFDLNNGRELWKYKTGFSISCDVSAKDGKIYFGSDDGNFYCLDTAGILVWKKDLRTKFQAASTFYKDLVITAGIDGNVYAMNSQNGDPVWTFKTKGAVWATPLLHKDLIFIGSYDRRFYCLDAGSGKELWNYLCEGRVRTSAVVWKDYIFTASDDKYVYCFSNKEMKKEK